MNANTRTITFKLAVLSGFLLFAHPTWAETAVAGEYKVDPEHSSIWFSVNHLGISDLAGRFNDFQGNITLQPRGDSKVKVTIQTGSVDTAHSKRDGHLRGPDFFNAKQHPTMHFASRQVSYNVDGEPIRVEGDLTLLGETRPVTLDVTPIGAGKDPWGGYRAGYKAMTTLKRSSYGMNFMQGAIGDEVAIILNIEAIKQ